MAHSVGHSTGHSASRSPGRSTGRPERHPERFDDRREEYSIVEVARMSGLSSRALRHYDDIGLLPPARIGSNGYRYYGRAELLRLQEIMILRELGLGLAAIGKVLAGESDRAAALRRHRERLLAERDRLDRLVRTVEATLADLEGAGKMAEQNRMRAAELFEGFDPARQARYEEELVERYGPEVREQIDASWQRIGSMTRADAAAAEQAYAEVEQRMAELLEAGVPADDERVLDVLDAHYATVRKFWVPNAEQYAGLGELYVDSPDFRARYDARHPRLAEYLRDGMAAYALARLS